MSVADVMRLPTAVSPIARHAPPPVLLQGVSWQTYKSLRRSEQNNHLRMTYDQGALAIMSPYKPHGKIASLLALMIYEWTRWRQIEIESGRDLTCDREDMEKGLEPDLCYWIANQPRIHGKDELDFRFDPVPDIALEVDISRSSISKLPIYAALKVPEVWIWNNGIQVLHLDSEGGCQATAESREVPGFPLQLASDFIQRRSSVGENALMDEFVKAMKR
jgi:Uma2 family endonuclease